MYSARSLKTYFANNLPEAFGLVYRNMRSDLEFAGSSFRLFVCFRREKFRFHNLPKISLYCAFTFFIGSQNKMSAVLSEFGLIAQY